MKFGTDGVRTRVGTGACQPNEAKNLGSALALYLASKGLSPIILVCRDTRLSGSLLAHSALVGMVSQGTDVIDGGVCPTPCAALWGARLSVSCVLMITASHNPYTDNGYKLIWPGGRKFSSCEQQELLSYLSDDHDIDYQKLGQVREAGISLPDFLKETYSSYTSDARIVLDCAHGAYSQLADRVLRDIGCEVISVASEPNGLNINEGVGSTAPEFLVSQVRDFGADMGFAFDGDGDRLLVVTQSGTIYTGDDILWLMLLWSSKRTQERNCVVTIMSHQGFIDACHDRGIHTSCVSVGDHHVSSELMRLGARFGGEPSGHVIDMDHCLMCDGLYMAVSVLRASSELGIHLDDLRLVRTTEQQERSCRFDEHQRSRVLDMLSQFVLPKFCEGYRCVVRASGTEPLIRILLEGQQNVGACADMLREHLQSRLSELDLAG